jgi:Sec-independent protein translocase protein TatA
VFGVGVQEMAFIGLLFLIIFGPGKLPQMARDLGQFVNEARRAVDGFKEDLVLGEEDGRKPDESGGLNREEASEVERSGSPSDAAEERIAPVGTKCNSPGPSSG